MTPRQQLWQRLKAVDEGMSQRLDALFAKRKAERDAAGLNDEPEAVWCEWCPVDRPGCSVCSSEFYSFAGYAGEPAPVVVAPEGGE